MEKIVDFELYNVALFLLNQREYLNIPMKSVAVDLDTSLSTISRIENMKMPVNNITFDKMLTLYQIERKDLEQANKEYKHYLYLSLDEICRSVDVISNLEKGLLDLDEKYGNIKIPISLINHFVIYVFLFGDGQLNVTNVKKMEQLAEQLEDKISFYSLFVQKIIYIFLAEMHFHKRNHIIAYDFLMKAKQTYNSIGKYDVLLYSCLLKTEPKTEGAFLFYDYYAKYNNLCIQYNLSNRLIIGKINYGIFLRNMGLFEQALENDIACFDNSLKESNIHNFYYVLLNNIGLDYKFLGSYDKAIEYFNECLTYWNDYDTYFELIYCLYKNNNILETKNYILIIKQKKLEKNIYYDLILWVDKIVNEKYDDSKKRLLDIYEKYFDKSSRITKRMILLLLCEQFELIEDYQQAYIYAKKLINI